MPAKVAFMQLSSCWGCHQSLLNAHLGLLAVLPELEIVYWPAVVDFKLESLEHRKKGEIIVGFIEGFVRTEEDLKLAKLMREKCAIIVAMGACANHGSTPGLANLYDKADLLKCKFQEKPSIGLSDVPGGYPNKNLPPITDVVKTVTQVIDVDVKIPGCPPRTENLVSAIIYLLTLLAPAQGDATKNVYQGIPEGETLIDQGKLCFGAICAPGKNGQGLVKGEPWLGTYGLTSNPDVNRAKKLFNYLKDQKTLSHEDAVKIKKFLILALNLPALDFMYFKGDPLQVLAKHPETYSENVVEGTRTYIYPKTGNEVIDNILGLCLFKLKESNELKFSQATVCSHCDRKIVDKTYAKIKRDYEGIADQKTCFLEQGYICIGPVTQAGCGAICPNRANAPCLGCYGPPENVPDQGSKMISTYAALAQISPEEVKEKILDPAGLFYRFSLPTSIFGGKIHDKGGK